jgi:ABC-type dipeptide/oligopeptide/nickel transport system permease component
VSETMDLDHVRVARSKGLAERTVVVRHVLKNAMIPITTVTGLQAAFLLGGTIIVETIFAIPGLGRLALSAINLRDYPLMMGIVLIIAVMVSLASLIADLLYAVFDPRIRVS